MKLVHWPLMGGLLHLVQREGAWFSSLSILSGCQTCRVGLHVS